MSFPADRRSFLRKLGVSAAALPFVTNLSSLARAAGKTANGKRKQRLIIMFSPNGIVRKNFWPDETGKDFKFKEIMTPLEPYKNKTLILNGVGDQIKGDGDNHMRGIGCLLTGTELFPGNIQGGSHTPAGWASGISIDQEIKNFLQKDPSTRTRFGSLEFGVMVPDRADTWTRMVYTGANKPLAPIDNPYQMFNKLYGRQKDQAQLKSILDDVREDLRAIHKQVSKEDQQLLVEHASFVRELEVELQSAGDLTNMHAMPNLEQGIKEENDNMPKISRLNIELIVNSFANDFARVGTLQYTNSVGGARHKWLGVDEGHHELSHEPNSKEDVQEKLTKINKWYCEELAHLCKRLAETKEPAGEGSLLDNTLIVWTNELGEGNSHTLNDIPFVMVGNMKGQGYDLEMGRSLKYKKTPHNRLLMSLAHGFGHRLDKFGNPDHCSAGPLDQLTG
jgi:hypothetical protein